MAASEGISHLATLGQKSKNTADRGGGGRDPREQSREAETDGETVEAVGAGAESRGAYLLQVDMLPVNALEKAVPFHLLCAAEEREL